MAFLNNITKKVTETAKAAAKKSGDIVEVTKLNMSIGTEEEKIEKIYLEIGKMVYDVYLKGEEIATPFKEQCEKIKEREQYIKELKNKLHELKGIKICSSCGEVLDINVNFCSNCGAKQESPEITSDKKIEPEAKNESEIKDIPEKKDGPDVKE